MTKIRISLSIDPDVHKKAVAILKESGVKFSAFVEIVARGIIEGEQKTFNDMFQSMTERLIQEATGITKVKRR